MKNRLITAAILLCAFIGIGWANQSPSRPMEYKFVYQCDEKKANNLAAEGWELQTLSMASYGSIGVGTCAFKRQK